MVRRVAITGAGGQLGRQLVAAFSQSGDDVLALARPDFDITSDVDLAGLTAWNPDVVVNSAAWTDVDGCARDPERAMAINGEAAGAVARAAAAAGAFVVQISTNEVFDGEAEHPYSEDDAPAPINPYGASKFLGEQRVAEATDDHLIARTAWLFGPNGTNFVTKIFSAARRAARAGDPLRVVDDEIGNPTPTPWLAGAVVHVVGERVRGPLHLAGTPATTRFGWARHILDEGAVELVPITLADYPRPSRVPPRAALADARARELGVAAGDWQAHTRELVHALGVGDGSA